MRYIIALTISCLVTAAGLGISRYLHRSVMERVRAGIRTAAADGTLPKELEGMDPDTMMLEGVDVKLPEKEARKLLIADILVKLWFVWIPATFGVSIAIAYFAGGKAGPGT
jgi:hypothetical protein